MIAQTALLLQQRLSTASEEEAIKTIADMYGSRAKRALEAVMQGKVKKYVFTPSGDVIWCVVGREREYLVIPYCYCSCEDHLMSVVVNRSVPFCYHILAVLVAQITRRYKEIVGEDLTYYRVIRELLESTL
ncbi:MAG: hypothetical protein DRN96_00905 [Thermoproteota archaeon]|nr:MAG: hypothetical protein DRN99_09600 [Candidatus Korarchaeota archaeon]RLG53007.1 MAG: hypothetical protein DRN96_00905 [Candidatus Korarchaeota archaeon]